MTLTQGTDLDNMALASYTYVNAQNQVYIIGGSTTQAPHNTLHCMDARVPMTRRIRFPQASGAFCESVDRVLAHSSIISLFAL